MASTKTLKYHRHSYSLDDDTVAKAQQLADGLGLHVSSLFRLLVRQAHQQQQITVRGEPPQHVA
jgi:antitoxin component of RelBE/YafQ-DinJ toxin-antitoxin module